jgi:hypothetical protein
MTGRNASDRAVVVGDTHGNVTALDADDNL